MKDILGGPPSGPSIPGPKLMYISAVSCPANCPGRIAIAPPLTCHLFLLVVGGLPPPGGYQQGLGDQ